MKTSEKMLSTLAKPGQTLRVLAVLAIGLLGSALAVGFLGSALVVSTAYAQRNFNQPSSASAGAQPLPPQMPQTNSSSSQASNTAQTPATSSAVSEKPDGKAFPSPAAAAAALCHAARRDDTAELLVILGPQAKDLINPDDEQDAERLQQRAFFVQRYDQMHRLVREPDDTVALYIGAENWPLPIPIVQYNGSWYFDSSLGKQEVLYRQIGRNEMEALGVSRALVDAEKEYFGLNHSLTARFVSASGSHDGLYWKTNGSNARSPIGPYLADAGVTDSTDNRQPFHGYFYRIVLQRDGSTGNGNGFVVVAFPAEYRNSGVMAFFVDANGNAYEKDLGPQTSSAAMQITSAHPDNTWNKATEQAAERQPEQ